MPRRSSSPSLAILVSSGLELEQGISEHPAAQRAHLLHELTHLSLVVSLLTHALLALLPQLRLELLLLLGTGTLHDKDAEDVLELLLDGPLELGLGRDAVARDDTAMARDAVARDTAQVISYLREFACITTVILTSGA